MNQPCIVCGRAAAFRWIEHGVEETLCSICLDRRYPPAALGQLTAGLRMNKPTRNSCPHCGTTPEMAIEAGLVGCPLCYEVFDAAVWRHFGITPGSWTGFSAVKV